MDRYAIEAMARADELLDLFSEEEADIVSGWLNINEDEEMVRFVTTLSPRIETLLGQAPSKDQAWMHKTPRPKFLREWLAARYWAIVSARALALASQLQALKGQRDRYSYRQAVRDAAPVADRWMQRVTLEELPTLRMLDQWSGEPFE